MLETTYIGVDTHWREELQFKKEEILDKLNSRVGKNTIKDIRFL
jgi:predicted nucleic acid-binding Zn ribbon protein